MRYRVQHTTWYGRSNVQILRRRIALPQHITGSPLVLPLHMGARSVGNQLLWMNGHVSQDFRPCN